MATATKPRMKDEGSRMKRRRRAEGGRRKGHEKRPETQGDFYVTGVKTLTVAKVPGLRAAACVVNDRGAYHAGFRLIAGLQSPANCMSQPAGQRDRFSQSAPGTALRLRPVDRGGARTEREVKAAKLKRSLAALADAPRGPVQQALRTVQDQSPKTQDRKKGGGRKGEGGREKQARRRHLVLQGESLGPRRPPSG